LVELRRASEREPFSIVGRHGSNAPVVVGGGTEATLQYIGSAVNGCKPFGNERWGVVNRSGTFGNER